MADKNKTLKTRVQLKHETEANWNKATNFIPLVGEIIIYEPDEQHPIPRYKIGDGTINAEGVVEGTKLQELPFVMLGQMNEINAEIFNDYLHNQAIGQYSTVKGTSYTDMTTNTITHNIAGQKAYEIVGWGTVEIDVDIFAYISVNSIEGLEVGDTISLLGARNYFNIGQIDSIESVEPDWYDIYISYNQIVDSDFNIDENGNSINNYLYVESKPTVGNIELGKASSVEGMGNRAVGEVAHAEGLLNKSLGYASHTEGMENIASNNFAHAEGRRSIASGNAAHAEGLRAYATGTQAHAEGRDTVASGAYGSHAEGYKTQALSRYSHAEGRSTQAGTTNDADTGGLCAHAEGNATKAFGDFSHAEGDTTEATGQHAHAEGQNTIASGRNSHAEGYYTKAEGAYTHAEGVSTQATGENAHAEGLHTIAQGTGSHAEGESTQALHRMAHAEGYSTIADGIYSHAEGNSTHASGSNSHAEGQETQSNNDGAHAEGVNTIANGIGSHAEGGETTATGSYAHTEGYLTSTTYRYAHAEGRKTVASGESAHAEGEVSTASGTASHAEGQQTTASGRWSHAEGSVTKAIGDKSHAGGRKSEAHGENSFAHGQTVKAKEANQFVVGKYNADNSNAIFIVGNGTGTAYDDKQQANAFMVLKDGRAVIASAPTGLMDVANKAYVDRVSQPLPPLLVTIDENDMASHTPTEIFEYVQQGGQVYLNGWALSNYENPQDQPYAFFNYVEEEGGYGTYVIYSDGSVVDSYQWPLHHYDFNERKAYINDDIYITGDIETDANIKSMGSSSFADISVENATFSQTITFDQNAQVNFDGPVNHQNDINMFANRIHNLLDPINLQDASTKNYVDQAVASKSQIQIINWEDED